MSKGHIFCLCFLSICLFSSVGYAKSLSNDDIKQIQQQQFGSNQTENSVIKIIWDSQDYYLIHVSNPILFANENRNNTQRRLELLSKSVFLKYLQNEMKELKTVKLNGYRTGLLWTTNDRFHALFYVKQSDVALPNLKPNLSTDPKVQQSSNLVNDKPNVPSSDSSSDSNKKAKETDVENINMENVNSEIKQEISLLEIQAKTNSDQLSIWENLQILYRQLGDVENYNRVLDKILELK